MTYFKKFPLTRYEVAGKESVVRDILRRATFLSEQLPYTNILTPYLIEDGDTPQSLAMSLYGATTFHWIVLMFNEIHNPYFDWPISPVDLEKLCIDRYGDAMYMTRHQEKNNVVVGEVKVFNKNVPWVPPAPVGESVAISFFDYEERLNDSRRSINLLRPELLGEFVAQFEAAINV